MSEPRDQQRGQPGHRPDRQDGSVLARACSVEETGAAEQVGAGARRQELAQAADRLGATINGTTRIAAAGGR